MNEVRKTVIKVVVLSGGNRGDIDPTDCSLEEIAHEMDTGSFLGTWDIESTTVLPSEQIDDECSAVGNDGSFFQDED